MARSEEYQQLWHKFVDEHGGAPATPREVVEWAVGRGLLALPRLDPKAQAAEELARAMRDEYRTDPRTGARYRANHAVRITANGIQFALWAEMETAPRAHMEKAFAQRRQQIVADCYQLKADVDAFNSLRADEPPVQLVLDFTLDVEEMQELDAHRRAA